MYPTTLKEWWSLAENNAEDLRTLTIKYHPDNYRQPYSKELITAPAAEDACQSIREEIRAKSNFEARPSPIERFNSYLTDKNPELCSFLNEVWFGMPESSIIRSEPGFFVLCDLCSEGHLLEYE